MIYYGPVRLIGFIAFFFGSYSILYGQKGQDLAAKFSPNVVGIKTPSETGWGLIVGEENNELFIITPRHVVPDSQYSTIFFCSGRHARTQGTVQHQFGIDLSMIKVSKPNDFKWRKKILAPSFKKNDRVWYIGRGQDCYIPTLNEIGTISGRKIKNDRNIYIVAEANIWGGSSGAPMINRKGVISMITEADRPDVWSLDIHKIGQLVQNASYPWQLETRYHWTSHIIPGWNATKRKKKIGPFLLMLDAGVMVLAGFYYSKYQQELSLQEAAYFYEEAQSHFIQANKYRDKILPSLAIGFGGLKIIELLTTFR